MIKYFRFVIGIIAVIFFVSCKQNIKPIVGKVAGIKDLSQINLDNEIVELDGDADFYWEQFLTSNKILQDTLTQSKISLSHSWDNQRKGDAEYTGKGYATYHFRIIIPQKYIGKEFILRPNHFISYASQIYYNNKLISNNGSVGTFKRDKNYRPARYTVSKPFIADSSILDIVIWCANFDHFRGGIFREIRFGLADKMIAQREKAIAYDLIVIISLLIMFVYHFVLHFVNRSEKTALLFSFTCLVFALDLSFQDTMSFYLFFPNASFRLTEFLHLSMPFLIPCTFIFFLDALFPNDGSKYIRNATGFIALALIAITVLNIQFAIAYLVKPHFAYNLFVIGYVYFVVIKAVKNNRDGAVMFLTAFIVFSVFAINDILLVYEIINTASMVSAGLIIFIILVSILQGRLLAKIDAKNLKLTSSLQELNRNLEQKVDERTQELNQTLEGIKKLSIFKEDMTNTIIHDLKTPLNAIINAKLIKDENSRLSMVQQAGYKMMNLVKNILDVYRYDSAEIELNKIGVDLIEVVETAREEIEFSALQKSIDIVVNGNVKCFLHVDFELIQRVFVNILSNAVYHSANNTTIEITASIESLDTVRIGIYNQGEGITKDKQAAIFERFGQAERLNKSNEHKSGLGLTFCKMAIEAHGGRIGVVSEEGKGVEFWFTLPESSCHEQVVSFHRGERDIQVGLTDSEKEYLKDFVDQLKKIKIFEISAINIVLKAVEPKSVNIEKWCFDIERAVYSGDNKVYTELLNR